MHECQVPPGGSYHNWRYGGLLRQVTALASAAILAAAALAQDEGPTREDLTEAINKLRKQYLANLDAEKEDPGLRDLIRELNTFRNKGDWTRVAEVLTERGLLGPAPESGETPGEDAANLWPVRTGEGDGADKDAKFITEKAEYDNPQGLKIGAFICRPREPESKMPIIVLAHGGFRGIPVVYRKLAEELAGVGYFVFAPEFRGQGKSGGKVEYAGGEVVDLLAGLEAAKGLENVDANRVGLVGGGHGGAVVLLALARVQDVMCASVISPPTDLERLVREVPTFARELRLMKASLDVSDADALRRRSPVYYAAGVEVPVQILHGGRDHVVPFRHVEGYAAVLESRGKEVEFLKYGLSGSDLVSKISTYRVDMHNFLAKRLRPPGWELKKKAGKGTAVGKKGADGKAPDGKPSAEDRPSRGRRKRF